MRQRIIVFDTAPDRTHNLATFYPIMDLLAAPRADLHPQLPDALSPANLPYFGRGCQMNMIGMAAAGRAGAGFRILNLPTSCVIPYPDGGARYTGMEMTFDALGFSFQEAAYGADGAFWGGAWTPAVSPASKTRVSAMFRLIGTMKIKPDKIDEWEAIIARRREQVLRDEDFTLIYDFYRSAIDPCEYVVIEGFADESGHERHLEASIGHEAMIACFAAPPSLQKMWPVRGCSSDAY